MDKIILAGAGGHCVVIIDALRKLRQFNIIGIVDNNPRISEVFGIKVIGSDRALKGIFNSGCKKAFITVGSVGNSFVRVKLDKKLKETGFEIPQVIHPGAVIAEGVILEEGVFVAAGAVIGPGTRVGRNAIINTNASVDHDCIISDFVHISPGVALSGAVEVGAGAHIGTGSSVIERVKIGKEALIGAGSVVVSDIPEKVKAFGNPCKVIAER